MFDLELSKLEGVIKDKSVKTVGVQLPEGLKDRATEIADHIENAGKVVILFADPCYGACDLADEEAQRMGCDLLIHFGHSRVLGKTALPVLYMEVKLLYDPLPILEKEIGKLPDKIGLITTVQHVHLLKDIQAFLEDKGKKVVVGGPGGRAVYPGQVLGCSFRSAKDVAGEVDAFLYVGTGDFHPLGVLLSTGKPVWVLDFERAVLRSMDEVRERILRKRFAKIALAAEADRIGVIIGEKKGQMRLKLATTLKALIEDKGKEAYLIAAREITPETVIPFRHLGAFVNTACPRLSIDDSRRYKRPVLTPQELEIALKVRPWEDYEMDEIG